MAYIGFSQYMLIWYAQGATDRLIAAAKVEGRDSRTLLMATQKALPDASYVAVTGESGQCI